MIKISKLFRKLIILSLFFLIFSLLANPASAAITWNQTSQVDFEAGILSNVDGTTVPGQLSLSYPNDTATDKWTSGGMEISTATNTQQNAKIVDDGSGGAIIAWEDARSDSNIDIYAQKINSSGTVQWTADGVAITTATGDQSNLEIVSDGSGGAIIAWVDTRGGNQDIYAQRINSQGIIRWTSNGIVLTNATNYQRDLSMVADGSGGAIITWMDTRNATFSTEWDNEDIYAQRIDTNGDVSWTANGIAICTSASHQIVPKIASDGGSGAIITWQDARGSSRDIYAQKVNSSGTVQWTGNGVVISSAASSQESPEIIADGSNGAIIAWDDWRNSNDDIYAQKVNSSGTVQWTSNGVAATNASGDQAFPSLATDGSGGVIIAYIYETGNTDGLHAQHIDTDGVVKWTANGEYVSIAGDTYFINMIPDNAGNVIVTWPFDYLTDHHILTQRIGSALDGSFKKYWTFGGGATAFDVNINTDWWVYPVTTTDGAGGAIVAWSDTNGDKNIYTQKFGPGIIYETSGTYTSPVYDAGSNTKFSDLKWIENLPANTDLTFQTRTASETIQTWQDDFNDGNVDNIINGDIAFPEWHDLSFAWPPTEIAGILTFVNPQPVTIDNTDDYYFQIDTGYPADYFPGGSTVTANITIITESTTAELYMFVDGWDVDSGYTNTLNTETTITYTSASDEPFNTIGFDLYLLDHQLGDDDQFLINSITVEPPAGSGNFSAWSAEMTNPLGTTITSPSGRYIQYQANFTTTDTNSTPTLNDVTLYMGLSGNVDISANIEPTLSLSLSSTSCNLGIMSATDLNTCSYNITVNTNGSNGYNANIRQDARIHSAANMLADVSGGVGTITAGTEAYGFATSNSAFSGSGYYIPAPPDAGDCASYAAQHATAAPAKTLTDSDFTIAQASEPVADDTTTICHIAAVSGLTPAGTYSHTIIVTVVGNF